MNLTQVTSYIDQGCWWFSSVPTSKWWDSTLFRLCHFLPNPFQFIGHPTIQYCIVPILLVSSNNPQKIINYVHQPKMEEKQKVRVWSLSLMPPSGWVLGFWIYGKKEINYPRLYTTYIFFLVTILKHPKKKQCSVPLIRNLILNFTMKCNIAQAHKHVIYCHYAILGSLVMNYWVLIGYTNISFATRPWTSYFNVSYLFCEQWQCFHRRWMGEVSLASVGLSIETLPFPFNFEPFQKAEGPLVHASMVDFETLAARQEYEFHHGLRSGRVQRWQKGCCKQYVYHRCM
jgi:hypothetical protein